MILKQGRIDRLYSIHSLSALLHRFQLSFSMHLLLSLPISFVSLCISAMAMLISGKSMLNSSQALKLAKAQETRRSPFLKIYLAEGTRSLRENRQCFSFRISVSNPTDSNNAIARAELQVNYILHSGTRITFRLQHDSNAVEHRHVDPIFSIPAKIDAHQTIAGWLVFGFNPDFVGKGTVDTHDLLLEDSHGLTTKYSDLSVQSWLDECSRDDNPGSKPKRS